MLRTDLEAEFELRAHRRDHVFRLVSEQVAAEAEQLTNAANPMRHSAREVLGLSAYKAGDFARAKEWFEQVVNDAEAPRNLSNRAQMLLDLIAASGKAS